MAAETQGLHSGLRLAQRYQLLERIARGALASVYRGQDLVLRRPVAVKAVPREHSATYRAALDETSTLAHPAAVCIYDAIEQDGTLFIVQELITAKPLGLYFRQGVPLDRGIDLGRQLACAVAYAHVHGVVHGDLTPAAVLVDRTAAVRINNFGLPPDSTYFARVAASLRASLDGEAPTVETPAPTSAVDMPEMQPYTGESLASTSGDTRAIGYLLWQLLSEPVAGLGDERGVDVRRFRAEVPQALRALVIDTATQRERESTLDPHMLVLELERLAGDLTRGRRGSVALTPPAIQAARAAAQEAPWSAEETLQGHRGVWSAAHPTARTVPDGAPLVSAGASARAAVLAERPEPPPLATPQRAVEAAPAKAVPIWGPREAEEPEPKGAGFPLIGVLLLGMVLFVLFFLVGYFAMVLR